MFSLSKEKQLRKENKVSPIAQNSWAPEKHRKKKPQEIPRHQSSPNQPNPYPLQRNPKNNPQQSATPKVPLQAP